MQLGALELRAGIALLFASTWLQAANATAATCLKMDAPIELAGSVTRETHYGPPTFGEHPATDKKMRVPLLRLANPTKLCTRVSNEFGTVPSQIRKIQIINQSGRALPADRRFHTFSGVLFQAENALHFTPVIFLVKKFR